MKISKRLLKEFEADQAEHGTATALFNYTFLIATDVLKSVGVKKIKVQESPDTPSKRKKR